MTREEAIKRFETLLLHVDTDCVMGMETTEAINMAISALKAQMDGATISRQAAIDAECEVCRIAPRKERGHNCTYYVHGCKEIECLRALPSAQPDITRCKDCKYSHDEYGDGECYCKRPGKGLDWLGQRWDFYCADAKPKEEP